MDVEMSVSDARAKRRTLAMLQQLDHDAVSGPVRAAHPFCILVRGVRETEVTSVRQLVASIDPGAHAIAAVSSPALALADSAA